MKATQLILAAGLLAGSDVTLAQQPAQPRSPVQAAHATQSPQLTSEQRAQLARQDAEMTQAAGQVMQLVDANRLGEVWEGASAVMKQLVTKDEFVRQITADRSRLGAVSGRSNPLVTRTRYPAGADVPEGLYVNVSSASTFANQPQPIRELVSFRLDDDRTFRVSGYSLRAAPSEVAPTP